MWVLKLGGSLANSPELPCWLTVLTERGGGRVVVVPGGGLFADAIRQAQGRWRFPDTTAHHMALLAMDQYGWMLVGMEPRLVPVPTLDQVLGTLRAREVPVWLPSVMMSTREDIPASWDITSDSLAAWLALELQAEHLFLVKSVAPAPGEVRVRELCTRGVVDSGFPIYLALGRFTAWWLGSNDHSDMIQLLEGKQLPRTRIVL